MNKGRGEHFQKFAKNSREKFPSFWGSGEEFDEIQLRVSWGEKLLNVKRNITQLKGFTHKNGKKDCHENLKCAHEQRSKIIQNNSKVLVWYNLGYLNQIKHTLGNWLVRQQIVAYFLIKG